MMPQSSTRHAPKSEREGRVSVLDEGSLGTQVKGEKVPDTLTCTEHHPGARVAVFTSTLAPAR